jgi:glycosyltransferase involved in cell wall biosynthesis
LVIHVADLWVTALVKLGYLKPRGLAHRMLATLETLGYRFASAVIVVSRRMVPDLTAKRYPDSKIHVIANGVDTEIFYPLRGRVSLRKELNLEGKFIALFAGTHGLVTDITIFADVAKMLSSHPDVHFLFVGDGVEKQTLIRMAREKALANMTFLDPQPESRLAQIVNECDIGLSTLKPGEFTEHVIPVKTFLYMACAIPVVATDKEALGEVLREARSAILVREGDPKALRDSILELYQDDARRTALGTAGARFVAQTYSRRRAALATERLFLDLTAEMPKEVR